MIVNYDVVGVCSRSFSNNQFLREELLKRFPNAKFNDSGLTLSGNALVEFLEGCKGAIIALEFLDSDLIKKLPNLQYIGKYGVGLDKIDLDALEANDIKLGWTPGVNSSAVAELTIALSLDIVRKVTTSIDSARLMEWTQIIGGQLSSLKYGIIGCGHVGSKVARLAAGFGCEVFICDVKDKSELCNDFNIRQLPFENLLSTCDIVSIHIPYNRDTENLFDNKSLGLMKDGAYLINTARGGIVDEDALLDCLNNGKLSGAAFDVLKFEPPVNDNFINHNKTIVTTHIGGSSQEAIKAMGLAAIRGLTDNTNATYYKEFI